jgi:CDP-glucose 4,6-dehydratase
VLEPLSGYLLLAERLWADRSSAAEAWNFGPDSSDAASVGSVADRIIALWGDGAQWVQVGSDLGHEASMLSLDSAKARNRLGWRSKLRLPAALEWTVGWYRRRVKGAGADALVLADIERYEAIQP